MENNTHKGNPRANNPRANSSQTKVSSSVARSRAIKSDGLARSGNPRAKKNEKPVALEGFSQSSVSEIKKEANRQEKESKRTAVREEKRAKKERNASEKREHKNKPFNLKKFFIGLFLLALAASAGAFVYLANADVLEITEVEYVGADHLTQAECEALAPSPVGQNLLTFDSKKIENGFLRDAWVDGVEFKREWPHKLNIVIKERKIGAIVDFNSGANQTSQSWVITLDGTWIMAIPDKDSETGQMISQKIYEDSENAVHIKDCPNGIAPEIGGKTTDDSVVNALNILNGFSTDLKDQVKSISVPNLNATTLRLKNNVEIAFGTSENIRDKERIAKEIMEQNDKVVYINVRSTDRPTWRSAS